MKQIFSKLALFFMLTYSAFSLAENKITIPLAAEGDKEVTVKNIKTVIEQCTVCDLAGNHHLFYLAKADGSPEDNPFNFSLHHKFGTNVENLKELENWLEKKCVHCAADADLKTGQELLTEISNYLYNKLDDTAMTQPTTPLQKTAQKLAEDLFKRITNPEGELFLYAQPVNQKQAQEYFRTKYANAKKNPDLDAKNTSIRQMIFDDLCATGLLYKDTDKRPSNFIQLWESFEKKHFCDDCLKKIASEEIPYIWNISRPKPLSPAFGGATQVILSALNMLSLSDITVDEYAGGAHSPLLQAWPSDKKPARKLELDTQWAEHYKSRNPDKDPAITYGYLTTNALEEDKGIAGIFSALTSPARTIKKNFLPIMFGVLTTYFNVDDFNPKEHTKSLSQHLFDNMFSWSGVLDTVLFASNLAPLQGLPQAAKERSYKGDFAHNFTNFALGRGASPLCWAQTLGANQGSLMLTNMGATMFTGGQSRSSMLIGQSLGLLLRGHMMPGLVSIAVPALFNQFIQA